MPDSTVQPPAAREPELGELLHLMHVVDVERQKRDLALLELSVEDQKKRLREELQKVYTAEGANVSESEIDAAIEAHYADRFVFKPPPRTFAYQLARLFAARYWVFTRIVAPLLIIQAIVLGIAGVVAFNIHQTHVAEQKATQIKIEQFHQSAHQAQVDLDLVKGKINKPGPDAGASFNTPDTQAHLQRGADRLHSIDQFLVRFCPNGSARRAVTLDNYREAGKQLVSEKARLAEARDEIANVESFWAGAQELLAMVHSIDTQIAEIRASAPPDRLLQQSETAYRGGRACFERSDRDGIRSASVELARCKKVIGQLKTYRLEAIQLSQAIAAAAKEKSAIDQSASLLAAVGEDISLGDPDGAKGHMNQYRELRSIIETAYVIRIVDRAGVKTGVARTPKSNHNVNYYYLIVEAVTPDNKVLRRSIASEETQESESLTLWAERVPKELFEQIRAEKQQNGRVANRILMTKDRGYLTEQPARLEKRIGQITKW